MKGKMSRIVTSEVTAFSRLKKLGYIVPETGSTFGKALLDACSGLFVEHILQDNKQDKGSFFV